jgi:citrate lyase subunit beta/citryl-CoA lyase
MRSLLFIPGDSERKMERGLLSGSDTLILDLEDSVAESQKAAARALVSTFLKAQPSNHNQRHFVRVNPMGSDHFRLDLGTVVSGRPDGIVLPKSDPEQVRSLSAQLTALEETYGFASGSIQIICIATETPSAIFALGSYAGTSIRLRGLAWGAEDLAASLGAVKTTPNGYDDVFRLARSLCLLGAGAAGIDAFDTVYTEYRDLSGLKDECIAARRSGFAGKLAIHPDQVATINEAFSPDAVEVAWARRVVAAFSANPKVGAVGIDGKMLDRPHLILAQRLLSRLS